MDDDGWRSPADRDDPVAPVADERTAASAPAASEFRRGAAVTRFRRGAVVAGRSGRPGAAG
jgi:hypothetical protein